MPATLADWMSLVPDDTSLAAMNIPGTRSSLSYLMADTDERIQGLDLIDQLSGGSRIIDITCDATDETGQNGLHCYVPVLHGGDIDVGSFDIFAAMIVLFLQKYPSETIILFAKSPLRFGLLVWYAALMNVSPALPILRASTMTTLGAARGKVVIMRTFDQLIEPPPAVPGWVATPWSLSEIANVGIGGFSAIEQDVGPFYIYDADLSWGIGRKRGYVGDLASKGADFDGKTLLFNIGGTEVRNDVIWFEPRTSIWTGWTTPGTAALLRDLGRDALPNELLGCVLMDHPGIAASLIKPVVKNYLAWSPQVTAAAPRTTRAPWLVPFDGLVYAFHEIDNGGGEIVYSTRPLSGGDWSPDESASGPSRTAGTSGPPSAVAVKTAWGPRLLVFSEGASNDGWLWLSIFDGISWGDPIQPRQPNGSAFGTRGAPGLAIVGDTLFCVRRGQDGKTVWWSTYDMVRDTWSADNSTAIGITGSPALVATRTGLHLLHQGMSYDGNVWHSVFDGSTWSQDRQLFDGNGGALRLSDTPALLQVGDLSFLLCQQAGGDPTMMVTAAYLDGEARWGAQKPCLDPTGAALTTNGRPGLLFDGTRVINVTEQPANLGAFAEADAASPIWDIVG